MVPFEAVSWPRLVSLALGLAWKYSPAVVTEMRRRPVYGAPDPTHISTAYIDRQNLNIENVDAPVHPANECVLDEGSESTAVPGNLLHALQLRALSHDARNHPGRRPRADESRLDA